MSTDGPSPRRLATTVLAAFDILVGLIGGGGGVFLTVFSGLSVHPEDMIPPFGLAVACGLLGFTGVLLLSGRRREAGWSAGLAAIAAAGGIATGVWRHIALRPSEGGMLMLAGLAAVVTLVALAEFASLRRGRSGA